MVAIFLNAFENNEKRLNSVDYDNVSLVVVPPIQGRYYLMHDTRNDYQAPSETNYKFISGTNRELEVKGATSPFYVILSENYNKKWRLALGGNQQPDKPHPYDRVVIDDSAHFKANGYSNAWYVDPNKLCLKAPGFCERTADGKYTMTLVADFTPQEWFDRARLVSSTILISCLLFLTGSSIKLRDKRFKKYVYRK
jgi:hypothetical protein